MLSSLNDEDRLIGLSMVLTLGGISLGSAFEEPRFLGYTALLGITILILTLCVLLSSLGHPSGLSQ